MSDLLPLSTDPFTLPTPVLEAELIASVASQNASIHAQLRFLAAYDQRGAWMSSGSTSCAVWWANVADIAVSTANDQLRVAKALVRFASLDRALYSQRISYAKARSLARYAEPDTIDDMITIAERVPAGRLGPALAGYRMAGSTTDEISARQHAARSVSWQTDPDGMIVLTARLSPIDGAQVSCLIDAEVMTGSTTAGDLIGQQRSDALMKVLARRLSAAVTHQASAEIVVHVAANSDGALTHTLEDGTPLPQAQASELMCGSTIRALVHDSNGKPIDASSSAPRPSKRQLRLLKARDRGCQYHGCGATSFLHAHHILFRENGGPTTIANLVLLCSLHHRYLHTHDPDWLPSWRQ